MPTRDDAGLPTEALFLLWAARETGALDALAESAGTPAALAAETDLTGDAAETVVRSLAELGFLERVGGEYEPTNRMLGFLAKRDPHSTGRVPHALDRIDALTALPAVLTGDDESRSGEHRTANRLGAAAAADEASVRARVTAALREVPNAETVLAVDLPDPEAGVAPGPGVAADAREFAARDRAVTYLADAAAVDATGPMLSAAGVEPVSGVEPVAETVADAAERYDLVYAVDRFGAVSSDAARAFVADAADLIGPGGAVVLLERIRDRLSPEDAVIADVRALASRVGSGAGSGGEAAGAHASDDYRAWGESAGLTTELVAVPGSDRTAVVYRRPERTVQED
ncbi:hypothetical protein GCM10027435_10280 [Haloparvum alkalitolerans]|uniref:class I SAM-dependent methyltransferase n=1 Tax=Haloparvum alkalitolerans TaxID=1042953 RepID=UPI003CE86851